MAFNINTNVGAMNTSNTLTDSNNNINKNMVALSTAMKLNKASDDAASLAIADKLMTQVSGYTQQVMNANDSIGMIQIADGAMNEQNNILDRVNTLSLQASNAILGNDDRAKIQQEIDRLMESYDNIANTTSYNGMGLLNGSGSTPYTQDTRSSSVLSQPIDVTTVQAAKDSLNVLQDAQSSLSDMRADNGSVQNQLYSEVRNLTTGAINAAAAESQLRDLDFAQESADFSKNNLLVQTGSYALAQQNTAQSYVLNLLK